MRIGPAVLAWMAAMAGLANAGATEVVAELRAEVLVAGARLTLADVAQLSSADPALPAALGRIVLGEAPLAGQVARRSQAELDLLWRTQPLSLQHELVWRGAQQVRIHRRARLLDSAQLLDVARQQLRAAFAADDVRIEASLAAPLPDLLAPEGALQLRARLVDASRLRARMAVRIDVVAQDGLYRSVLVPLAVSAQRSVCVARQALPAGTMAGGGDFEQRTADVAALDDIALAPAALAHGGRVRQALAAGQVVTARQMALGSMLLKGDPVRLRATVAGIAVETSAIARADAALGQMVQVMPAHGTQSVSARVAAPGLVEMEQR